jgi:hypothetical protein
MILEPVLKLTRAQQDLTQRHRGHRSSLTLSMSYNRYSQVLHMICLRRFALISARNEYAVLTEEAKRHD